MAELEVASLPKEVVTVPELAARNRIPLTILNASVHAAHGRFRDAQKLIEQLLADPALDVDRSARRRGVVRLVATDACRGTGLEARRNHERVAIGRKRDDVAEVIASIGVGRFHVSLLRPGRADASVNVLVLDGSLIASSSVAILEYDNHAVTLGADLDGGMTGGPFAGVIDDLRLYDRALAPHKIAQLAHPP